VCSGPWLARESALSSTIKLISRTSTTFVKKKAALTLLRLYRKHPSVVPVDDWADRIVDMIGDRDPGVSMNAVTLVTTMAQDNLDAFQGCYKLVVERLDKLIFDGDYPSEYVYYKASQSLLTTKV
jgi:AP-2 complex subunit alpha